MAGYKLLKDLLVTDAVPFSKKWPSVRSVLHTYNISLLDLLKIMPGAASARIVYDYQSEDYFKMLELFEDTLSERAPTITSHLGFSEDDPNLPYKRIAIGEFEGSEAMIVHGYIMNEILPRGLYHLLKNGMLQVDSIFKVVLNFHAFLNVNLQRKQNIVRDINDIENATVNEHWIRNTITLVKRLESFLIKAFKNEKQLFEQVGAFLTDYKTKVEGDSIACLRFYPILKGELINALEKSIRFIHDTEIQNSAIFKKFLTSKLKHRTYAFLNTTFPLDEAFRDFENDYNNKQKAIQYLNYRLNNPEFLVEIVETIGKSLDLIFYQNRADRLGILQDISSLLRFNDLLIFEVPEIDDKHALLTRIILWRLFCFSLHSSYADVVLGYMIRKFKHLLPKIETHQSDYVYALFCYLYVMDSQHSIEKEARTMKTNELVANLLEMFLSKLDMKVFCRQNYFLRLDYANDNLRKNMAHIIKPSEDINSTFDNLSEELIISRKFLDKSVLLIAFAKKILLNLYINAPDQSLCHEGKLKLYATLMLLFDMRELLLIDKKSKTYNYLLIETKLRLIIDCFGLIGAYSRSYSQEINEIHKGYDAEFIKPLDAQCTPRDLIKFLQEYVSQNQFYKNINIFAVFKTIERAEKLTQDIQHSQIFYDKVNFQLAPNSFDMIKWVFNLALSVNSEFYGAFDMCLEVLVGDQDLGFILIPFILYIYLQNCEDNDVNKLVNDININLKSGHGTHKMILINAIKQLEKWYFEANQIVQSALAEISQKKPNKGKGYKAPKPDESTLKMENFCLRFNQIKKLIDMEKLIINQASFGDYKGAALNLEKLLENINTSNNQIFDGDYVEKLGLLYSIYSEINEDFKDISFEHILQKLKVPYEPSKIKEYTSQLGLKSSHINQPNEDLIYKDDKHGLVTDSDVEMWIYMLSRGKVKFNDDSLFFGLLVSLVSLSCHLMNTSSEYKSHIEEIKSQADNIVQNAKISLAVSLMMVRNNYHSLYPFFLKAQLLADFEILFKLFRYTYLHASKINHNLIQSMAVESETFEISLDEMHEFYFMNTPPNDQLQFKIILFINICLKKIEKRIQSMEASYKVKLDWINVTKFMVRLMTENVKYYFDKIYNEFLYKLLKLTYKNNDYKKAEIYYKKLISSLELLKKPIKCQFLLAKLTKKLKGKKDAIKILNEVKAEDGEKIFEIKARLKVAKYMLNFYAENDVEDKYKIVLNQYREHKNEFMYFQYAKFQEEANPNPEAEKACEIVKYYLESIKYGHEFIFQSLPRALRIWLDCCIVGMGSKNSKKGNLFANSNSLFNNLVANVLGSLETYKLVHIIQVLVSRLDHPEDEIVGILCSCLAKIATYYPLQSVWWLLPLKYFNFKDSRSDYGKSSKIDKAMKILNAVKKNSPESWRIINDAEPFYKALLEFAAGKESIPEVLLKEMKTQTVILPLRKYLDPVLPKKNVKPSSNYNPYDPKPAYILCMDSRFQVMPSKEKPKKITFICSDGKKVNFLLKYEQKGDVRKESRTIDYVNFVTLYLESSGLSKDKGLKMKSFSIIPLCSRLNLSEWVNNTATFKSIIEKEWKDLGMKNSLRYTQVDQETSYLNREIYERFKLTDNKVSPKVWEELIKSKSVFQYYFWNNFGDPNEWYDASLNYVKTTALWSAFGYLIGMGDRHCDNILLEKTTGEAIHIDFDCIFHKGKYLPVPEIVEFRLTKNIEGPMGAFKSYALFEYYLNIACKVFQKNIDDLLGALDSFVNDPLIENQSHFKPSKTLEKIKKRLMFSNSKNMEEGIAQVIEDCKNEECLREMFLGWMPYM